MTYGTGTRSYNRSAEKRNADKERARATAAYQPGTVVEVGTGCPCCRRVHCVWGVGPVWATSPDWVKARALTNDQRMAAERTATTQPVRQKFRFMEEAEES